MTYNIRSGVMRWQMPDFLSDGNSNVCSISHRLPNIRKSRKLQDIDLENDGQGQWLKQQDMRHSTKNIRIHIGDIFQNFENMLLRKM